MLARIALNTKMLVLSLDVSTPQACAAASLERTESSARPTCDRVRLRAASSATPQNVNSRKKKLRSETNAYSNIENGGIPGRPLGPPVIDASSRAKFSVIKSTH